MQRVGSRCQVMHGNAKQTGGGLKKERPQIQQTREDCQQKDEYNGKEGEEITKSRIYN
jgi:hypothetical protein